MHIESKFHIGDLLEDTVTSFTGVVMVVCLYATGCLHYGLLSRVMKEQKPLDWEYFDESRLILVERGAVNFGDFSSIGSSGFEPNPPQHPQ